MSQMVVASASLLDTCGSMVKVCVESAGSATKFIISGAPLQPGEGKHIDAPPPKNLRATNSAHGSDDGI
jgi:hypothetical protein